MQKTKPKVWVVERPSEPRSPSPKSSTTTTGSKSSIAKPHTKFGPWFKAQFGVKLFSIEQRVKLLDVAEALEGKAEAARFIARQADVNDLLRDAALKGWVAGYEACKAELEKKK
jgi:hypothetical protein